MTKSPTTKSTTKGPLAGGARLFVDAIEDGHARLVLDDAAFTVPARLLPNDAREGTWIRLTIGVVPAPPSRAAAIRSRLAKDDPGGPLKL